MVATVRWTVAPCLQVFSGQLRSLAPGVRIDTIGDADHSARASDHNPDDDQMVCALDAFDHKLVDDNVLALALADPAHRVDWPRIKYVINGRRIWSPARADEGWRPYRGPNPHDTHCHLSVTQAGKRNTHRWSALEALRRATRPGVQARPSVPAQRPAEPPLPPRNPVTDRSVTSIPESAWTPRQRAYADMHGLSGTR